MVEVNVEGKDVLIEFWVLCCFGDFVILVEVCLIIGWIYQICVYVKYVGYVIVGDLKYGDEDFFCEICELGGKCLFLYVVQLCVLLFDGQVLELEVLVDEMWQCLLECLND